jgi:thiamine biosynthesis protein ThiS
MPESLQIHLNGQTRTLEDLTAPVPLDRLIDALGLQSDRIAVECNGTIAPRTTWPQTHIQHGDKLEIVHFVGGGRA